LITCSNHWGAVSLRDNRSVRGKNTSLFQGTEYVNNFETPLIRI
jgi:hypothetical protein